MKFSSLESISKKNELIEDEEKLKHMLFYK